MYIYRDITSLRRYLDGLLDDGKTIGFVPTMGALHPGHMSLLDRMNEDCDVSVFSIFVNPTQFNSAHDLDKYPRPIEDDIKKLYDNRCDVVFIPAEKEIYPKGVGSEDDTRIDFKGLDERMEGIFRPGHFEGVAQVMHRLLTIVRPHLLFMGQKDFQQTVVVKRMIDHLDLPVKFVTCPTIRESDGLAMSSRNRLLDPGLRGKAPLVFQRLEKAKADIDSKPIAQIRQEAIEALSIEEFKPEYFEIADGNTLLPVEDVAQHNIIVACCAVWVGDVRLIDNIIICNKLRE